MADTAQNPAMIAALAGSNPQAYQQYLVQQQQLARNQAMAQALMQQTMSPDNGVQEVSGRVVPYSVGQGLTQLAKALMVKSMNGANDQSAANLGMLQGQMYAGAKQGADNLIKDAPSAPQGLPATQQGALGSGTAGILPMGADLPAVPPSQDAVSSFVSKMNNLGTDMGVNAFYPSTAEKYRDLAATTQGKNAELTNEQKLANDPRFGNAYAIKTSYDPKVASLMQANVTPDKIGAALLAQAQKEGQSDLNGVKFSGNTPIAQIAPQIPGSNYTFGNQGGLLQATGATPIANAAEANAGFHGAQTGAEAAAGYSTVKDASGNDIVVNTGAAGKAGGAYLGLSGGGYGAPPRTNVGAPTPAPQAPVQPTAPTQPTVQPVTPRVAPYGQSTMAQNTAKSVGEDWTAQQQRSDQAQPVIAKLQTMDALAQKARLGQFSNYIQGADGVLSMLGSNDATQRAVAGQLLGKNAAQIQTLMANGKTDAASAAIAQAFPNQKMLGDALHEAVQNLVAQQHIEQSRTQYLQPFASRNDAQGYTANKIEFNNNADQRIFQWKLMPPGPEKVAYGKLIMAQDPSLLGKAQWLEKHGGVQ